MRTRIGDREWQEAVDGASLVAMAGRGMLPNGVGCRVGGEGRKEEVAEASSAPGRGSRPGSILPRNPFQGNRWWSSPEIPTPTSEVNWWSHEERSRQILPPLEQGRTRGIDRTVDEGGGQDGMGRGEERSNHPRLEVLEGEAGRNGNARRRRSTLNRTKDNETGLENHGSNDACDPCYTRNRVPPP